MKRMIVVFLLLALLTIPVLAQDDCPGCPEEYPPPCGTEFALVLCLAALRVVKK